MNFKLLNLKLSKKITNTQRLDDVIIPHLEEDAAEEELLKSLQEKDIFYTIFKKVVIRKRCRRTHRCYLLPLRQLKRVIWRWNCLRSHLVNLVDRRWNDKRFGISLSHSFIPRNHLVALINLHIWRVCWLVRRVIVYLGWVWLFKIIRKL